MKTVLAALLFAVSAAACAEAPAPVSVHGAWARPIVPGQDSTGAYMTLAAREPLTLLGAETPAAGIVEIHEMQMVGDVMKMRAAETLPLVPGKPLELKPNGLHFMLMDLKAPFKAGSTIRLTLRLRDAKGVEQKLPLTVPVAASAPAAHR
jgi:periplasmic copper chaperone A